MSIQSESVLTFLAEEGNFNRLASIEASSRPRAAVFDLGEVTPAELAPHVLFVPNTRFHFRVEFEEGPDVYLSFEGRVYTERDDLRTYVGAEVYDLHLDGFPADADELEAVFPGGMAWLEEWLIEQEAMARKEVAL
jgi:hypothetical protein